MFVCARMRYLSVCLFNVCVCVCAWYTGPSYLVCWCVCVCVCVCTHSALFATSLAKMVQVAVGDNCEGTFSSFDHI